MGNFFNREAFGGYTNGPLAMQIPLKYFEQYGRVSELKESGILDRLVTLTVNGKLSYIQVHPTFLYEDRGIFSYYCAFSCIENIRSLMESYCVFI